MIWKGSAGEPKQMKSWENLFCINFLGKYEKQPVKKSTIHTINQYIQSYLIQKYFPISLFFSLCFTVLMNTITYMLTGHSCARWITPLFKTVITIVQVHMYLSTRRRHKPKNSWLPSSPTLTKATGGSELLIKTFWCQVWASFINENILMSSLG